MTWQCAWRRAANGRRARPLLILLAVLVANGVIARRAAAQIDYRNLDDDRPTLIEDAYPAERFAFELLAPYRYERGIGGRELHLTVPELEYGVFSNTQVGFKLPFARISGGAGPGQPAAGSRAGLAGVQLFGLYNFNTEGPLLPALAVRGDVTFGVGSLGGTGTRGAVKFIATRSWGATRIHLNVARGFWAATGFGVAEGLSRWTYGGAVDRTLWRRSLLVIGEVYARQALAGAPTEVNAGLGLRYQWRATTVLDMGVGRRLRSGIGPDLTLTVGLSHAFALAGLMPAGR